MRDKINILYLHNIAQISGGERSLLNLWQNIDRERFDLFLLLPEEGPLSAEAKKLGVKVSFLNVPQIHPINTFSILNALRCLLAYLKANHIHLIHSHTPRNNILGALAGKFKRLPVIWHERNLLMEGERDVSRQFLFLADTVICNSQAVARRFERNEKSDPKIKVILNGVNLNDFQFIADNTPFKQKLGVAGQKTVGFVSNLNKRKRVEFFLEVAAGVAQKIPEVKFFIVGGEFPECGGQRLDELKSLVQKLRVQDKVIFTGFTDDIRPYLYALDVFVHVTLKEACSRAIIEAMAVGKPVVAVNDGGNPELIEHGQSGFLVGADDLNGFVDTVVTLLNDETKRNSIATSARHRAERFFDVKRNARETQEVYLGLVR